MSALLDALQRLEGRRPAGPQPTEPVAPPAPVEPLPVAAATPVEPEFVEPPLVEPAAAEPAVDAVPVYVVSLRPTAAPEIYIEEDPVVVVESVDVAEAPVQAIAADEVVVEPAAADFGELLATEVPPVEAPSLFLLPKPEPSRYVAPPAPPEPEPIVEPEASVETVTLPPAETASESSAVPQSPRDFAAMLTAACPAPALVAFLSCGTTTEASTLVRDLAGELAARTAADVVLLGPGILDDAQALTSQWSELRRRTDYGFVHASADTIGRRVAALRAASGVVLIVELGHTSTQGVELVRSVLAQNGIHLRGVVALDKTS
jgi:hypothetical protein